MSRPSGELGGGGELPPDLERLRVLETWLALSLGRVREQIAAIERARPPATPGPGAAGPRRRAVFEWGICDAGAGVGTVVAEVHRGDCWAGGGRLRAVSAERARAELAGGVRACAVCRPDVVLRRL